MYLSLDKTRRRLFAFIADALECQSEDGDHPGRAEDAGKALEVFRELTEDWERRCRQVDRLSAERDALEAARDRCAEIGLAMVRREAPGGDCPAWLFVLWEALERADAELTRRRKCGCELAAEFSAGVTDDLPGWVDPDSDPDDGTEGG